MACQASVKQVLSGDSVMLLVPSKSGGIPLSRPLTLAGLVAPRMAMKTTTRQSDDEPFAFGSREYLRKLVIGKSVEFRVTAENSGRELGCITIVEANHPDVGLDVATLCVRNGWAKLRSTNANDPEIAKLMAFQTEAEVNKLGLWGDDVDAIRRINWAVGDVHYIQAFAETHKGKTLTGIVEFVRDGGCCRVYFPNESLLAQVFLTGITCDGFKRDDAGNSIPDPLAEETKLFLEIRILNRELQVTIDGVDAYGSIYATLVHPNGNIAILLLGTGYAKTNDFSLRLLSDQATMRRAQKEAQNKKLKRWRNFQPPTPTETRTYTARVLEVVSADQIIVVEVEPGSPTAKVLENETAVGTERRLYLASIRAPRPGNKTRPDEPYSFEAKEFARKRLVGNRVRVTLEFARVPFVSPTGVSPPPSDESGRMHFVSVAYTSKNDVLNLSEQLVLAGLASVQQHRPGDEERASNYDELVAAEQSSTKSEMGIHSKGPSPKSRINDLIANPNKARSFEPSLRRVERHEGFVEMINNASRFRIRIPTEGILISFIVSGMKCPQTARPPMNGQRARDAEPFAEDAVRFARLHFLQRPCVVTVEACDRGGNFLGSLWMKEGMVCVRTAVVARGYGKVTGDGNHLTVDLVKAQEAAKKDQRGMWSLPDAFETAETFDTSGPLAMIRMREEWNTVHFVHAADGPTSFYVQLEKDADVIGGLQKDIAEICSEPARGSDTYTRLMPPKKNEVVLAQFSQDNQWYRGKIENYIRESQEVMVRFLDFGNEEKRALNHVRRCPHNLQLSTHSAYGKLCSLAGVKLSKQFAADCASGFDVMVAESTGHALLIAKEESTLLPQLVVWSKLGAELSVNEEILEAGLGRVDKRLDDPEFAPLFVSAQDRSVRRRQGIWRYCASAAVESEDEDNEAL